jgi:CRISPR/Cas system-associated endonuclease Cas1
MSNTPPINESFSPYLKHQGRTREEQIRLNQPAMEWLKKRMEEKVSTEEARAREEFFAVFKETVDSFRSPGSKLYADL